MSPVAEAIKELGTLVVATAGLLTSIGGLVAILKTRKLVDNRTDQLLEATEYKGRAKALEESRAGERETRREVLDVAKEFASVSTPTSTAKMEDPKK